MVGTKWIAKLAIDDRLLGVIIMCLVLVGTYSRNYRLSDTMIAIAFGVIGLPARQYSDDSDDTGPGPRTDHGALFRQGIGAAGGDLSVFVTRPVSLVFMAVIFLLIGLIIRNVIMRLRTPTHAGQ